MKKQTILIKFSIVFLINFLLINFSLSAQPNENAFVGMRNYVVSIGTIIQEKVKVKGIYITTNRYLTIGSGFLTYVIHDSTTLPIVVTAGHVVKHFREKKLTNIYIRPSWADTISIRDYFGEEVPIVMYNVYPNTFLHPDTSIDLGCIVLNIKKPSPYFAKGQQKNGTYIFAYNQMSKPLLGEQVWICGYPGHVEDYMESKFQYSIATFKPGNITWKPDDNMLNKELNHITLVESNATYGNSGGPVFAFHSGKLDIVGILVGGYEESDLVYLNDKPVVDSLTNGNYITKRRAGVSIIEKAINIKTLLHFAEEQINILEPPNRKRAKA